jgi:hypothetical protein
MVSSQKRPTAPDPAPQWQPILDEIIAKRRAMKPHAERLDGPIRSALLKLQSALALPGVVEPASVAEVCDPFAGLPDTYVEYMNHRRNYDYWNSAAAWSLSHQSSGLHSAGGPSNTSFAATSSICIAVVLSDLENAYINAHVYPSMRLSIENRPRIVEIFGRETGLAVRKCTLGDGCI